MLACFLLYTVDNKKQDILLKQEKGVRPEMNVLYYAKVEKGPGEQLQRLIEALVPQEKREVYRTIGSLYRRLCRPNDCPTVAVILAATREDLLDILSIRDLLLEVRIILILPDREESTIALGHTLRPRFLSYIDGDVTEVAAVLAGCLECR